MILLHITDSPMAEELKLFHLPGDLRLELAVRHVDDDRLRWLFHGWATPQNLPKSARFSSSLHKLL